MNSGPIDEAARRQLESDWVSGDPQPIDFYLPRWQDPANRGTLEELVLIDLEFRWSQWGEQRKEKELSGEEGAADPPPTFERYVRRYPVLCERAILNRLVEECLNLARTHGATLNPTDLLAPFPEQTVNDAWSGADQAPPEVLPFRWGNYVLQERLGEGAMGVVYRARHLASERDVALKRIIDSRLLGGDNAFADLLARFEAESQAAARLEHDCIVPVYDVGRHAGVPFYTMQLNEGGTLADLVRTRPLDPVEAARLIAGVAEGMQVAHEANLLHRDIKPANLLLDHRTGRAKIADFGLVRWETDDSQMTRTGQLVGTPAYMAPEQARDAREAGGRSDIYAIGATLYHLLTGRPPFQAATLVELLRQVMHDEPISPRRLNPSVPPDLDTICLRCLQKEPARRFANAADLAADLRRFVRGEPVLSRPVSWPVRMMRWMRRNPAVSLASSLAIVFAMAAVTMLAVAVVGIRAERSRYEAMYQQARQAVDDFYLAFTEDTLFNQPGMTLARRRYLLQALAYYQRFLEERQDSASKRDVAMTRIRVGALIHELESPAEAVGHFQTAIDELRSLQSPEARDLVITQALGDAYNGLGRSLLAQGQAKSAISAFESAVKHRRRYTKLDKADPVRGGRLLANSIMNRGVAHRSLGELAEAMSHQEDAQQQRSGLLKQHAESPSLRRDWAKGEFNLSALLAFMSKQGELTPARIEQGEAALRHLRQAEQEFRLLTEEDPRDLELRRRHIECLRELGFLESGAAAEQKAVEAVRLATELADDHPKVSVFQIDLAETQQKALETALQRNQLQLAADLLAGNRQQIERLRQLLPASDTNLQWLNSGVHFFAALLASRRQDIEQVISEFRQCQRILQELLKNSPDDMQARQRSAEVDAVLEMHARNAVTS